MSHWDAFQCGLFLGGLICALVAYRFGREDAETDRALDEIDASFDRIEAKLKQRQKDQSPRP